MSRIYFLRQLLFNTMKKTICSTILFLYSCFGYSQSLHFEKINDYEAITFSKYFSIRTDLTFSSDTLLFFNDLKVSLSTPGKQLKIFNLAQELNKRQKANIIPAHGFSYHYSRNFLVLRNKEHVFLFHFNGDKFKFVKQLQLKNKFGDHIYLAGNILYFYSISNYGEHPYFLSSGFLAYDLAQDKEELHTYPFDCLALTHLGPNKFIDFSTSGYIYCDPLNYKLYEFSYDYVPKDTILAPDSVFKASSNKRFNNRFDINKMGVNAVDYLDDIRSYTDTLDRIWMISYLDSNTLFVRLTRNTLLHAEKKEGQLFYDHIWVRHEGKWKLSQVKKVPESNTNDTVEKEQLWPYFLPGSKYLCINGVLHYIIWNSSSVEFPQSMKDFSGFGATNRNQANLKLLKFNVK